MGVAMGVSVGGAMGGASLDVLYGVKAEEGGHDHASSCFC